MALNQSIFVSNSLIFLVINEFLFVIHLHSVTQIHMTDRGVEITILVGFIRTISLIRPPYFNNAISKSRFSVMIRSNVIVTFVLA